MAGSFTQRGRPLRIKTPLGEDVLLLERMEGEEQMSRLFQFQLDLLSEEKDLDPKRILGQELTIEIDFGTDGAETRYIHGICARFAQGGRDTRLTRYHAVLVPRLWIGTLMRTSRIFQQMTVPDVLKKVLSDVGVTPRLDIAGTFEPRNYLTQYRESHFDFISRLMEEEGIFYYHLHTSGDHELVLANTPNHPSCPDSGEALRTMPAGGMPLASDDALAFDLRRESTIVTHKVTLWDHNFELPGRHLEVERPIIDSAKAGTASTELYDYPGEYAQRFDGVDRGGGERPADLQKIFQDNARTASLRAQELATPQTEMRGGSNCPLITAGHKFSLSEHYRADFNGSYVLTSVQHRASMENYDSMDRAEFEYANSFQCIPAAIPFRPRRITPRARIDGAQTAVVVGPSGSEIFTDKYGRVKVQFNWDREGQLDSGSSCWVRVSTPWAGKQWGAYAIPRVGTEVVVDFLEGDPDRPLITGMVYNADFMPPYPLPENATRSGVKTRSSQQGSPENFNELRFEDKKGQEEIYLHAEKDLNAVVENNETRKIGALKKDKGDQTVEIFNNQVLKVGSGKGEAADGSQTVEIYKDQTVTLETGNQAITVKQGNRSVTLDTGNETVQIKMGNRTVTLDQGNDALTLKTGNLTTTLKVGNATLELDVGNATTKAKVGKITEEAMQGIEMKVGQSSIKVDQMGVTIKGMMVKVEGQVQTQVKGLMTQVNADAVLQVKGGITMIN